MSIFKDHSWIGFIMKMKMDLKDFSILRSLPSLKIREEWITRENER